LGTEERRPLLVCAKGGETIAISEKGKNEPFKKGTEVKRRIEIQL